MTLLHQWAFDHATVGGVMMEIGNMVGTMVDDRRRFMTMVRELADNAVHHSGEGKGWCAAERADYHLQVVVRDRGQGIHGSLFHLYPDIDERQAVRWVFGGGVPATAGPDRGPGLRKVLDYTRHGATLLLETGAVALIGAGGRARLIGKSTRRVDGVVAALRVPLARDRTVE